MKKVPADAPIFKERKDGLLEYIGPTDKTTIVKVWQEFDAQIDTDIWSQASIAAAVTPIWEKATVKEFADQVEKSFGYIYKIARTYRHFTQVCPRVQKLTFKHHTLSLRHTNPHAALLHAREHGMSTVRFEEWILNEISSGRVRGRSALSEIKLSELREFLEHVEEVIADDFIANCPNKEFGTRLFGAWLADCREENKQLYISDIRELVRGAIEQRAARTITEIMKVTGIQKQEVESAVVWLIQDQEEYEWVEQGGETDQARGSNAWILQRAGARVGSDYNPPRTSSRYVN